MKYIAILNEEECNLCGDCVDVCPGEALTLNKWGNLAYDGSICQYCETCMELCPTESIKIKWVKE